MKRSRVQWAQCASQLLGASLGAAVGLRIMVGAITEARAERTAAAVEPIAPEQPALLALAEELTAPPPLQPPPTVEPNEAAPSGPSVRLMLSVVVGPERSEVYVNGRLLGLSPYLGDFTCKQGENLRIEVVPVRQPLISRQAKCIGRTLLIRD
jgi:hypothetical protein